MFLAGNPNFVVFLLGFVVCCGAMALYSVPLAGMVGGGILMAVAAYPFVTRRTP